MEKWICKVCNYTHQGDEAPESCPKCGAPKGQFYRKEKKNGCVMLSVLIILVILAGIVFAVVACSPAVTVDNSAVKTLDLSQYLGKWYEVARFDHKFERDMQQCTATYTLNDNGSIIVMNKGKKDGKWKTSVGKGKVTENPGVLRVSFFGPFYSDYRVMMLAPDYSYALVGGSSDDYLWILSRTPQLRKNTCDQIVREARRRGYDTDDLIWVKQTDL